MEPHYHRLSDLFKQLGLPYQRAQIEAFLLAHSPLPAGRALPDAGFWNPSQACFLRESLEQDSDWSGVVDQLSDALRQSAR